MGIITINGTRIEVEDRPGGNQISVSGDKVTVNGNVITTGIGQRVEVNWIGPAANVTVHQGSLTVQGSISGSADVGGSVNCLAVGGDVDAGGSVNCGNVTGDVEAGGSIQCGTVGGSVRAGGSISGLKRR